MTYDIVCSVDDRDEWLRQRRTGIGASEIAAVCGCSPWNSPFSMWAHKTGQVPEKDQSEPMRWGQLLEPVIMAEYAVRSGRTAGRHGLMLRSKEYPWALATLDGETAVEGQNPWPLEIKNASAYVADEWKSGPPEHYMLQIQQQALVTGANVVTSACLLGGNRLVWCDVPRDERLIQKIIYHGEEMWSRIVNKNPPPVDSSEHTRSALHGIFPESDGKSIGLEAEFVDVADQLEVAKAEMNSAKTRVTELENRVKLALGSASKGILPDGRCWSWTTQTRRGYTVTETSMRVLRMLKPKEGR
jgi:putative phage-type endonuclease